MAIHPFIVTLTSLKSVQYLVNIKETVEYNVFYIMYFILIYFVFSNFLWKMF